MTKLKNQSGQVAIVILLIMVVLLTVGLSLASRTTQEVFLSQQESQSARVFNAAEVGLEDALSQNFDSISAEQPYTDTTSVTGVNINTTINPNDELETTIVEGSAVHVDLEGFSGTLEIDWARDSVCYDMASLLVSIYYLDTVSGETEVIHETMGPNRSSGCDDPDDPNDPYDLDQFSIVSAGDAPYSLTWSENLSSTPKWDNRTPLFARVRSVYRDTEVRISGLGSNFPTQFYIIRSQADNDTGDESRTVEVGRTLSTAPSFMDYSVYSGADISIEPAPTPAP